MVRLSKDDLLAAWKATDRSRIDEQPGAQGWRGIRLLRTRTVIFMPDVVSQIMKKC